MRRTKIFALGWFTLMLLITWAVMAHGQTTTTPVATSSPSDVADIGALLPLLLQSIGLGKYVAGIVALYATLCGITTIIMPWLPVPTATTNSAYKFVYTVLNWVLAHNYRNAANATAASPGSLSSVSKAIVAFLMLAPVALTVASCGQQVSGANVPATPQTPDQALYEAQATLDGLVKQADVCAQITACKPYAVAFYPKAVSAQSAINQARTVETLYVTITNPQASDTAKLTAALAAVTTAMSLASDSAKAIPATN